MSFYRSMIAAVAAMGLATVVFAADATNAPAANAPAATTTAENTTTTATTDATDAKVNINTATAKDLMKVKGMTNARAKAIVNFRKKHGDFKSLDDLKQVKGFKKMNDKNMKDMEDQLTV